MRHLHLLCAVALVIVGCAPSSQFEVSGRISYVLEGVWIIHSDDGADYQPRSLPAGFQVDKLPVVATLHVLHGVTGLALGPVVDVLDIETVPAFGGTWRGRKDYLAADGGVSAWADWAFQIRMTGRDALQFVNGPSATVTSPTTFTVSSFGYPPAYGPGPPGHCGPVTVNITGGTGTLASDGTLTLMLDWTDSCGGQTSRSTTRYTMAPGADLASYEVSQM